MEDNLVILLLFLFLAIGLTGCTVSFCCLGWYSDCILRLVRNVISGFISVSLGLLGICMRNMTEVCKIIRQWLATIGFLSKQEYTFGVYCT